MIAYNSMGRQERVPPRFIPIAICIVGLFAWAWWNTPSVQAQVQAPIVLTQTVTNPVTSERELSALMTFVVTYTTGVITETRQFKYTTPENFAIRSTASVNLWLVFHGGGGNTNTMNRYFDSIPASAPTVLVFPEALPIGPSGSTKWRSVNAPGDEAQADAYRDIPFVEQLVVNLLGANPQLHPDKVYASGFSSGANMTWMLLCYRSRPFQGFAMFSQQLTKVKSDGGCGNERIHDPVSGQWTILTGYEQLTNRRPDRYGYNANLPSSQQANRTKAVFYSHGTLDDNLVYTGVAGCATANPPTCEAIEDPRLSLDFGGPQQDRDDLSTKDWLLARHDLLETNPAGMVLPDQDPLTNADNVTTTRRTYNTAVGTAGVTSRQTVRWLEMVGGVHALSTLDHQGDLCTNLTPPPRRTECNLNPNASKDYEMALEAKRFFERYAGMLQ